jgi:hypothetical protein
MEAEFTHTHMSLDPYGRAFEASLDLCKCNMTQH